MLDTPQMTQTGLSREDFYRLYVGQAVELEDGKVIHIVNDIVHQDILGLLHKLVSYYLDFRPIGRVYLAGYQMELGEDFPSRQPDLLVVLTEHQERLRHNFLAGPADIVVEIISPESRGRDTGAKFEEYEAGGVGEYWLIDPDRQTCDFYGRDEEKHFRRLPPGADGYLGSKLLPGFRLRPEWLWADTPPQGPTLLGEVQAMLS